MIIGLGKKLKNVRTVLVNDVNDVIICQDILNKDKRDYYTLIRVHDSKKIKDILESIYNSDGTYNMPKNLFCGIFVEVDTLNILMKYKEPRKLFLYLKSCMNSDYIEHTVIKSFIFECLALDVNYPILDLMLNKENINIDEDNNIFFNGFLDFSKFNKDADEQTCVKKCCDLINDILLVNEELSNKSKVKAINLFKKKKRNNDYNKMIDLYNDFKIKEKKYKKEKDTFFNIIKSKIIYIYKNKLWKILTVTGSTIIVFAAIFFICSLFKLNLPFTKYRGMDIIGTINMTEK